VINQKFNELVKLVKDEPIVQRIQIFKNISAAMLKEVCHDLNTGYYPDDVLNWCSLIDKINGPDHHTELIKMNSFYKKGNLIEAYKCIIHATNLPLGQKDSVVFYNKGILESETGKYTDALNSYKKSIELNPDNKIAALNLSQLKIKLGMWEEGWKEFEVRNEAVSYMIENKKLMNSFYTEWDGKKDLKNKTILILNDQGFGDLINFYRFFERIKDKGAKIILCCENDVRDLISYQNQDIEFCTKSDVKQGLIAADYYCSPSSLIHLLGIKNGPSLWNGSYISAQKKEFNFISANKKNVALINHGGVHAYDFRRSILLSQFQKIQNKKANLFLISKMQNNKRNWHGREINIQDVTSSYQIVSDLDSWYETAQLLKSVDLLISVDTGIAHLAGAMGVPTWVLLDYACDYRWGVSGETSDFYPTMKLFRQKGTSWDSVFNQVNKELKIFCS